MTLDYYKTRIQYLLPQHTLSKMMKHLTRCRIPWLKNWAIDRFIRHYNVDMNSAVDPIAHNYPDFNTFFTRALKPETRPLAQGEKTIVSPADGNISQIGKINAGSILQAKGFNYDLTALLGGSREKAALFNDGHFVTIYLSPRDYHRVHMPLTGRLQEMIYVPGKLFSVNQMMADHIPNLFSRNERVISLFETALGPMAIILVGAIFVGGIRTVWAGTVTPPRGKSVYSREYPSQTIELQRGAEMGRFEMGSTVIVLLKSEQLEWVQHLQTGSQIQFGEVMGSVR